jgi:hypothetical protein
VLLLPIEETNELVVSIDGTGTSEGRLRPASKTLAFWAIANRCRGGFDAGRSLSECRVVVAANIVTIQRR